MTVIANSLNFHNSIMIIFEFSLHHYNFINFSQKAIKDSRDWAAPGATRYYYLSFNEEPMNDIDWYKFKFNLTCIPPTYYAALMRRSSLR